MRQTTQRSLIAAMPQRRFICLERNLNMLISNRFQCQNFGTKFSYDKNKIIKFKLTNKIYKTRSTTRIQSTQQQPDSVPNEQQKIDVTNNAQKDQKQSSEQILTEMLGIPETSEKPSPKSDAEIEKEVTKFARNASGRWKRLQIRRFPNRATFQTID
eukprot:TRINITY_DN31059_c0_g5_i1.p1 TRINITY_DN31059_c0_g5~~TRINITY_DN31059_c0_g5_i1.p1  ORF type:complete len:157 (+),score=11.85 TRINITY_DN31059_c0_g5_i1:80-550(+)